MNGTLSTHQNKNVDPPVLSEENSAIAKAGVLQIIGMIERSDFEDMVEWEATPHCIHILVSGIRRECAAILEELE